MSALRGIRASKRAHALYDAHRGFPESALLLLTSLTEKLWTQSDSRLTDELAKTAAVTWLPYTLIDQVLVAAGGQTDLSPRARTLLESLRSEIASRTKRVQKYSQAMRAKPSVAGV